MTPSRVAISHPLSSLPCPAGSKLDLELGNPERLTATAVATGMTRGAKAEERQQRIEVSVPLPSLPTISSKEPALEAAVDAPEAAVAAVASTAQKLSKKEKKKWPRRLPLSDAIISDVAPEPAVASVFNDSSRSGLAGIPAAATPLPPVSYVAVEEPDEDAGSAYGLDDEDEDARLKLEVPASSEKISKRQHEIHTLEAELAQELARTARPKRNGGPGTSKEKADICKGKSHAHDSARSANKVHHEVVDRVVELETNTLAHISGPDARASAAIGDSDSEDGTMIPDDVGANDSEAPALPLTAGSAPSAPSAHGHHSGHQSRRVRAVDTHPPPRLTQAALIAAARGAGSSGRRELAGAPAQGLADGADKRSLVVEDEELRSISPISTAGVCAGGRRRRKQKKRRHAVSNREQPGVSESPLAGQGRRKRRRRSSQRQLQAQALAVPAAPGRYPPPPPGRRRRDGPLGRKPTLLAPGSDCSVRRRGSSSPDDRWSPPTTARGQAKRGAAGAVVQPPVGSAPPVSPGRWSPPPRGRRSASRAAAKHTKRREGAGGDGSKGCLAGHEKSRERAKSGDRGGRARNRRSRSRRHR